MESLVLTLHIIACLVLIVLVLLQSGKEGMGVIFGGGSGSMFGSSGAGGLLTKLTAFLAGTFLVTSLLYNILTGSGRVQDDSVFSGQPAVEESAAPAEAPAAPLGDDIVPPAAETAPAETPAQ